MRMDNVCKILCKSDQEAERDKPGETERQKMAAINQR